MGRGRCCVCRVWTVRYNPSHDQFVLSAGSDTSVKLWNANSVSSAPVDAEEAAVYVRKVVSWLLWGIGIIGRTGGGRELLVFCVHSILSPYYSGATEMQGCLLLTSLM